MPKDGKRTLIKVYLTQDLKDQLSRMAKTANISLSELCKRLFVGARLPDPSRFHAIKDIVKVNADLARLGNLLKLALDDKRTNNEKIDGLIDDIAEDRKRLKKVLDTIKDYRKT